MSKILIIIGLVLSLIFAIPLFVVLILYEAAMIGLQRSERTSGR